MLSQVEAAVRQLTDYPGHKSKSPTLDALSQWAERVPQLRLDTGLPEGEYRE